jgi:hypothetical protein
VRCSWPMNTCWSDIEVDRYSWSNRTPRTRRRKWMGTLNKYVVSSIALNCQWWSPAARIRRRACGMWWRARVCTCTVDILIKCCVWQCTELRMFIVHCWQLVDLQRHFYEICVRLGLFNNTDSSRSVTVIIQFHLNPFPILIYKYISTNENMYSCTYRRTPRRCGTLHTVFNRLHVFFSNWTQIHISKK